MNASKKYRHLVSKHVDAARQREGASKRRKKEINGEETEESKKGESKKGEERREEEERNEREKEEL